MCSEWNYDQLNFSCYLLFASATKVTQGIHAFGSSKLLSISTSTRIWDRGLMFRPQMHLPKGSITFLNGWPDTFERSQDRKMEKINDVVAHGKSSGKLKNGREVTHLQAYDYSPKDMRAWVLIEWYCLNLVNPQQCHHDENLFPCLWHDLLVSPCEIENWIATRQNHIGTQHAINSWGIVLWRAQRCNILVISVVLSVCACSIAAIYSLLPFVVREPPVDLLR